MRGFIYKSRLDEVKIREWASQLLGDTAVFHIVEDLDTFRPGTGIPADLKRRGRLFADMAEIRYEHVGGAFECLVLTERAISDPQMALMPVSGDWEAEDAEHILTPVSTPRVKPLFTEYPNQARTLSVRVYRDSGLTVFTRLRRFEP